MNECGTRTTNLSLAWSQTFLEAWHHRPHAIPGQWTVTIDVPTSSSSASLEDPEIRRLVDEMQATLDNNSCQSVANTIFPYHAWRRIMAANGSRDDLYAHFNGKLMPRIKKKYPYTNYFRRLTCFDETSTDANNNQLEHILQAYNDKKVRRPTALQAMLFDPRRDHTNQSRRGFPCMQSVVFTPEGSDGLGITAIYPFQYIVERAYGNYLGLLRLGEFMAQGMNRRLTTVRCTAVRVALGQAPVGVLSPFATRLRELVDAKTGSGPIEASR